MKLFARLSGGQSCDLGVPMTNSEGADDAAASRALARLDLLSRRPLRLALLGDFNTGKSTLAMLLLGAAASPSSDMHATRTPTLFRYGSQPKVSFVEWSGERHEVAAAGLTSSFPGQASGYLVVEIQVHWLRRVELIDIPGTGKPGAGSDADVLDPRLIRYVDLALWCTLATQAWKDSEKRTWLALPARLRAWSLLVATHADCLHSTMDREKIFTRLRQEASGYFRDTLLISASNAIKGSKKLLAPSDVTAPSGAPALVEPNPELLGIDGGATLWLALAKALAELAARRQAYAEVVARRIADRRKKPSPPQAFRELAAIVLKDWERYVAAAKNRVVQASIPSPSALAGFAADLSQFASASLTPALLPLLGRNGADEIGALFACDPTLLQKVSDALPGGDAAALAQRIIAQLDEELREAISAAEGGPPPIPRAKIAISRSGSTRA